jgi:5-methyltetrahydropteroyltriglutamate--homocysteine methyltransferase
VKITIPGPFTLSQQAEDRYYGSRQDLAMDYAAAVNEELRDLAAVGVDVVQLDEPYLQSFADDARAYAVDAINTAVAGVAAHGVATCLHTCFGYGIFVRTKTSGYPFLAELADCGVDQIAVEAAQPRLDPAVLVVLAPKTVVVGVIDLGTLDVESADEVAARVRAALEVVPAERLMVAPDCGLKYLPRPVARAKLAAMVAGTAAVRRELEGARP